MPKTLRLRADSTTDIERAAGILRDGGTVAFPTETVYGLGANALDPAAVACIFEAKQRPSWDPLIVHLSAAEQSSSLTLWSAETARRVELLAERFWPGPLTLLLPKHSTIPDSVTAGRPLCGFRVPGHSAALRLLRSARVPIAAPSANTFGHTSPTTAEHVLDDLDGRIDAVLDGGPTPVGVESTVIDPAQTPVVLYRPGVITSEQVSAAIGVRVVGFQAAVRDASMPPEGLPAPGVGIRHYAPRANVIVVEGTQDALLSALAQVSGSRGVLLPAGWIVPENVRVQPWGVFENPEQLAASLFSALRALDDQGIDVILCPLPPYGGINDAVRDRLMKAARAK